MDDEKRENIDMESPAESISESQVPTDFEEESVDVSFWRPVQELADEVLSELTTEESIPQKPSPSEVVYSTFGISAQQKIFGVTFLGRQHETNNTVCQDYHLYENIGDGWQIYLVSDGAGSAAQSHRGSKMNCDLGLHLVKRLIERRGWKEDGVLPNEIEWTMEFYGLCRAVKQLIFDKIDTLDEPVRPRHFNATFMLMVVTPFGMLCGHIGDGRMGYKALGGSWKSIITPHKGDEPNQTVFMMNEWDKIRVPVFTMSDVFVPEAKVICEYPEAIMIITDGCENSSWNCVQFDAEQGRYIDLNTPFEPFWDDLSSLLDDQDSYSSLVEYVDSCSEPSVFEEDDRTLIFAMYNQVTNKTE